MTVFVVPVLTTSGWFSWCRRHNARIRFHSNGTVEVAMNGFRARRKSFARACRIVCLRNQGWKR